MRSGDLAPSPAAPKVVPAVRPEGRRIDAALQIARAKTTEELFIHIRLVIAIAVLQEDNVRRTGHDEAAIRCDDTIAWWQVVCPYGGLVHDAVAIGIAQ